MGCRLTMHGSGNGRRDVTTAQGLAGQVAAEAVAEVAEAEVAEAEA